MIRVFLQLALFMAPWPLRRWCLCRLFGFKIAPTAKIGFSLLLVEQAAIGESCHIGHLTIVKGLRRLQMDEFSTLGNLNWVTGFPRAIGGRFLVEKDRDPVLFMARHAAITHRHYIDCTDRIDIGAFTTMAGWGSQILTHAIDLEENRQSCSPVNIGSYCFIGTRTVLLKGSSLPDKSVLAAGSVLTRAMTESGTLYAGVPASALKKLNEQDKYFTRRTGHVV